MEYIGKFISNFRELYNGINAGIKRFLIILKMPCC